VPVTPETPPEAPPQTITETSVTPPAPETPPTNTVPSTQPPAPEQTPKPGQEKSTPSTPQQTPAAHPVAQTTPVQTPTSASSLPFTGYDIVPVAIGGLALLALGAVLHRKGRRSQG
jgi:protein TonB